jgi:hypothetical protein
MDSSMSMMGRIYTFEAADSAAACKYDYQEMKVSGTKSYPFAWVEEPNSFRMDIYTLHFSSDPAVATDTTWEYKTFTIME